MLRFPFLRLAAGAGENDDMSRIDFEVDSCAYLDGGEARLVADVGGPGGSVIKVKRELEVPAEVGTRHYRGLQRLRHLLEFCIP